jgi:putative flippase GtrA
MKARFHALNDRFGGVIVQFVKFGMVGVGGLVIDTTVLYLCIYGLHLGFHLSRLVSYLAAATTTWALNRAFTFKGAESGPLYKQWAHFVAVNAFGGVVNFAVYSAVLAIGRPFMGLPLLAAFLPLIGVVIGSVAGMFLNFAASKRLVFKDV